ncbi:hypothetical protein [Streptomyces sp. SID1121]|uniref:hypothetical protein n=1 Tax=Streptomyces sp. SID1121 TaxID=3425888 RepID=UPI0040567F25
MGFLGGILLLASFSTGAPYAHADEAKDSQIVFCLSSTQRAALIDAAVILDSLNKGSRRTDLSKNQEVFSGEGAIEEWRERYPKDFDQACSALSQVKAIAEGNSVKKSSNLDFLNWLLPIVAGSFLTIFATELQAARARRLAAADAIRTTTAAFRDAVIDYTAERTRATTGGEPSSLLVDKQRTQLVAALRKVELGRNWPSLRLLTDSLEGNQFRDALRVGWHGSSVDRIRKSDELLSRMTRLEADTEQIATMSTSILPLSLKPLRKKIPTSVGNP